MPKSNGEACGGDHSAKEDILDASTRLHAVSTTPSTGTGQSSQPPRVPVAQSTQQLLHTVPSNESIHQLSPFFEYGCRFFLGYMQWCFQTALCGTLQSQQDCSCT